MERQRKFKLKSIKMIKMIKNAQTIRRQIADELFKSV